MDTPNTPASLGTRLSSALPVQSHLPVFVGTTLMPMVWVDGSASPDATRLHERLTIIGKCLSQFSEGDIELLYGQLKARWICAYGSTGAFFLQITIDAPPLTATVALPALHAEVTLRFSLDDATVRVLETIAKCRRVLLHFETEPEWVRQRPPLPGMAWMRDLGEQGLMLVRSGLPIIFRPDLAALMASQLDMREEISRPGGGQEAAPPR